MKLQSSLSAGVPLRSPHEGQPRLLRAKAWQLLAHSGAADQVRTAGGAGWRGPSPAGCPADWPRSGRETALPRSLNSFSGGAPGSRRWLALPGTHQCVDRGGPACSCIVVDQREATEHGHPARSGGSGTRFQAVDPRTQSTLGLPGAVATGVGANCAVSSAVRFAARGVRVPGPHDRLAPPGLKGNDRVAARATGPGGRPAARPCVQEPRAARRAWPMAAIADFPASSTLALPTKAWTMPG